MTPIPARIGPSRLKDAALAVLSLPLLGAALPFVAFFVVASLGNGPGHGDDGDGLGWAFLGIGMLAAPVVALAAGLVVAFRSRRSGYRLLPFAAALSPFALPVVLSSGVLWR
ncbi:hypothetical protein ACIQOW_04760 [Kitasatospora sp. NPDC091335]|uniref:hypothetical protein n=1 Tax=Kitasatospora sp. NPDC091335 TaxID=3364085 RepID=UPI0037F194E6